MVYLGRRYLTHKTLHRNGFDVFKRRKTAGEGGQSISTIDGFSHLCSTYSNPLSSFLVKSSPPDEPAPARKWKKSIRIKLTFKLLYKTVPEESNFNHHGSPYSNISVFDVIVEWPEGFLTCVSHHWNANLYLTTRPRSFSAGWYSAGRTINIRGDRIWQNTYPMRAQWYRIPERHMLCPYCQGHMGIGRIYHRWGVRWAGEFDSSRVMHEQICLAQVDQQPLAEYVVLDACGRFALYHP